MEFRNIGPVLICAAAVLFGLPSGTAHPALRSRPQNAAVATPDSTQQKTPQAPPAGYIGAQVCQACHGEIYNSYEKTRHRQTLTDTKGGPSKQGCEACHGPGAEHASDPSKPIFNFKTAGASEKSARCLSCHAGERSHEIYRSSEHALQGISCDQCHEPHLVLTGSPRQRVEPTPAQTQFFAAPKIGEQNRWLGESLLRKPQAQLCSGCHLAVLAQFALPTHHRVPEGEIKCTDCHEPHGTRNRAQLRETSWETCVKCHTEKRGPFVYEHASVKVEGCAICHSPHGSTNRQLLLRGEARFTCLECHVDPQAANVPHGRLGFQTGGDCVRCHATIHGSNTNEFFLN